MCRPDAQVDLDLGNYERFLDVTLTRDNNLTTGKVYQVLPAGRGPPSSGQAARRRRGSACRRA